MSFSISPVWSNLDSFFFFCDFAIVLMMHRTYEDISNIRIPRHWSYQGLIPVLVHTIGLWIGNVLTIMNGNRSIAQLSYGIAYAASLPLARKVGGSQRAWISSGYICISVIAITQGLLDYDPIYIFRLTQSHILTRSSKRLYRLLSSNCGVWSIETAYTLGQLTGGLFGCYYSFGNITIPLLWWISAYIMSISLPIHWIQSGIQYPYSDPMVSR